MARVKGDKRAVELDGKAAEPDESPGGGLSRVERSARAQSLWITAARTLAAILTMAIPMVLVRLLDQTTFGHYKQLFLVAETVLAVLVLGLPGSLYYFVPREPEASQQFQTQTLFLLAGLGVAGGAAVLALAPWLGGLFDAPLDRYAGWIALYTALTIPASLVSTLPMVDRRARLAALLVMASDLARTGLLIAVAIATRDLTSILAAACLLVMVQVTAVLAYLAWRRRGQPWRPSWALD
jgi:O-antigen/teichoic acid export membrane protein